MKKKAIAAAALSLALAPCICLFACSGDNNNEGGNAPAGSSTEAGTKLNNQVTGTKNTYKNIYGRAERNGGLFSASSQKSAMNAEYTLVADGDGNEEQSETPDTSDIIGQLYEAVKDGKTYAFQNKAALETYVIDVFTYTQIAQSIVSSEEKQALTKNYSVDYDVDDDVYENLTNAFWSTKVPEEMSFAGFDEQSHKVNILFKARTPKDKETGTNLFESVNSEMYYISDNDFGYAQFTYRYDASGNPTGKGFDYFSMKDKAMLEINIYDNGEINSMFFNGIPVYLSTDKNEIVKTYFSALENAFTARTEYLEQQNLALAVEAGIEGIESKNKDGKTVYVKSNSEKPYKVTFDYAELAKMK